jgi:hypothetical protein
MALLQHEVKFGLQSIRTKSTNISGRSYAVNKFNVSEHSTSFIIK